MPKANTLQKESAAKVAETLTKLTSGNPDVVCAFLIERNGTLLGQAGSESEINLEAISPIISGVFSASQTMAKQLADEGLHCLCHHGTTYSLLVREIQTDLLLCVIYKSTLDTAVLIQLTDTLVGPLAEIVLAQNPIDQSIAASLESSIASNNEPLFVKK